MLLRVDRVNGGTNGNPSLSTSPPLHACLATANGPIDESSSSQADATQAGGHLIPEDDTGNSQRAGEILTVGRKNCNVTISNDKCVSRTHASIRLLSNRRPMNGDDTSLCEGRIMMEFGTPSTPEEVAACKTADTGVICVVKDLGSKFGTFVMVDEELVKKYGVVAVKSAGNGGVDGDDTGDETDDEAAKVNVNYVELSEKQIQAVRLLNIMNDRNNTNASSPSKSSSATTLPKFQKLEANQTTILLPLSHQSTTTTTTPHVTVLFGPQGSAIRLSLLPLQFTCSRLKPAEQTPILHALHYIGGTHSSQWCPKTSTHLVTAVQKATAKHIMAWACRRPAVTVDYIYGLMARTSPSDPLPKEENFPPAGASQLDDLEVEDSTLHSMALKGYRIGVLVDDDSRPLSESAGADILEIYKDAPTDAGTKFESWWMDQVGRAKNDKMALVVIESSSKKCEAWMKGLHNVRDESTVKFSNQKNLAKAITSNKGRGELLLDKNKVTIEKIVGWDVGETGVSSSHEEPEESHKVSAHEVCTLSALI